MKVRIFSLLFVFWALPALSQAASGVFVYPVKEVIGFDNPSIKEKAPAFGSWLEQVTLPKLADGFSDAFKKEFGNIAVANIDNSNKHTVVVASLHLIRESQYAVTKMDNVEYHLPITMSIVFTNPNTSEVLYSFTDTSYAPVLLAASEKDTQKGRDYLVEASGRNYKSLLNGILQKAKAGYDPVRVEVSVVKVWKNLCILDKGSKQGVVKGDNLADESSNELKVLYETEDYAVAQPLLFKPQSGQKFSKLANKSVSAQWKKPKVLSMHGGYVNKELQTIADFFDSELSKESAFTLLPINDSVATLLAAVSRETAAGKYEVTNQRALPDYLIKFSAAPLRYYQVDQQDKFGIRVYEQYLLGELLDLQGRIVYSAVGTNRIEEQDVGGMVFDKSARREVVLKNAVVNLAEQFAKSIKFAHAVLPITKVKDGGMFLEDSAGLLHPNQNVKVFRNLGRITAVQGDVLVPIWDATVVEAQNGKVQIRADFPLFDEVKDLMVEADDVVIVDAITAGKYAGNGTSVSYCSAMPSKLGQLEIDDFQVISRGPGYLLPYSLYDNDPGFVEKVQKSVRYAGFKESSLKLGTVDTANRCLLPIHKVNMENRQTDECKVSLAVGYRIFAGQEKKGSAASQTKISISDVPESVIDYSVQCELSKNALGLLRESIVKVQYK